MIKIKIQNSTSSVMSINKSIILPVVPMIGSKILIDSNKFTVEEIIYNIDKSEIKLIVNYSN